MRNSRELKGVDDTKTYDVCGTTRSGETGRLKRVFEKNVKLRNTAALQLFN